MVGESLFSCHCFFLSCYILLFLMFPTARNLFSTMLSTLLQVLVYGSPSVSSCPQSAGDHHMEKRFYHRWATILWPVEYPFNTWTVKRDGFGSRFIHVYETTRLSTSCCLLRFNLHEPNVAIFVLDASGLEKFIALAFWEIPWILKHSLLYLFSLLGHSQKAEW